MTKSSIRHVVIPDCQIRPGDDVNFLTWIGKYIVDKQPDRVINLGDFADMPSLSSYDVGKKSFEGRRYTHDVEATNKAMDTLMEPIHLHNARQRKNGKKQYQPTKNFLLGNHEHRTNRAVENDPKLEGLISTRDFNYERHGWRVHDFLDVCVLDGIAYSHYFVTGVAGRPAGTAAAQLRKTNMSSIAGHQQGRQVAYASKADGTRITSIICGSCYEHDEDYLGPQGNKHWRGIVMLNEVNNGEFDEMFISLAYLKERYGKDSSQV
jgi:hypothetical protein